MKTKRIPFNLEKVKTGAKVVTRYGYPVRIGFYDVKNEAYPILALVQDGEYELPYSYTKNGRFHRRENNDSSYDLFIEEDVEETDDYNPYKATVESIADMAERYSELQSLEELKDFYNNVKIKCRDAFEYGKVCMINLDEEPDDNKPKFKVGDWIVQENAGVYKVTEICKSWYEVIDSHELHYSIGFDQESMCYLWTIQDAKHGDVLHAVGQHNDCIFIFNRLDNDVSDRDRVFAIGYCCLDITADKMEFCVQGPDSIEVSDVNVKPATKIQCDLLFQKMKEAGYEWNFDKKELKNIEKVKTRRMTNQELADWLRKCPEENREMTIKYGKGWVYAYHEYLDSEADEPVEKNRLIRRNHGEWQEPLIEI